MMSFLSLPSNRNIYKYQSTIHHYKMITDNKNNNILIVLFFIVMAAYFTIWYFESVSIIKDIEDNKNYEDMNLRANKNSYEILSIESDKQKLDKKEVITNKFVGKIDKDGRIVAISKDGSAYNIKNGVVLVSGMIIKANESSYSIYRIKDPEKSVSTN